MRGMVRVHRAGRRALAFQYFLEYFDRLVRSGRHTTGRTAAGLRRCLRHYVGVGGAPAEAEVDARHRPTSVAGRSTGSRTTRGWGSVKGIAEVEFLERAGVAGVPGF
ncbi:hypothetical protein ACRAWF_06820 [Streptomyces sp. L7]